MEAGHEVSARWAAPDIHLLEADLGREVTDSVGPYGKGHIP